LTNFGEGIESTTFNWKSYKFPPCGLFQDTGFQGYKPEHAETYQPKKKPKGKEPTEEEKTENTMIASIRILVEHVISGVKRCRIVKEVFRNTKDRVSKSAFVR
jgi:hypothetical protein